MSANPLVDQVVSHLPSTETTRDRSLAIEPIEGTWVWVCEYLLNIYLRKKKYDTCIFSPNTAAALPTARRVKGSQLNDNQDSSSPPT